MSAEKQIEPPEEAWQSLVQIEIRLKTFKEHCQTEISKMRNELEQTVRVIQGYRDRMTLDLLKKQAETSQKNKEHYTKQFSHILATLTSHKKQMDYLENKVREIQTSSYQRHHQRYSQLKIQNIKLETSVKQVFYNLSVFKQKNSFDFAASVQKFRFIIDHIYQEISKLKSTVAQIIIQNNNSKIVESGPSNILKRYQKQIQQYVNNFEALAKQINQNSKVLTAQQQKFEKRLQNIQKVIQTLSKKTDNIEKGQQKLLNMMEKLLETKSTSQATSMDRKSTQETVKKLTTAAILNMNKNLTSYITKDAVNQMIESSQRDLRQKVEEQLAENKQNNKSTRKLMDSLQGKIINYVEGRLKNYEQKFDLAINLLNPKSQEKSQK